MRAVFYRRYGSLDNLEVGELAEPKLGPDWVRVRVEAAAVNPVDWKILLGRLDPMIYATFPVVPGWDVAGTVEAIGPAVTRFAPGDPVFGYTRLDFVHVGTFAEVTCVPERVLARCDGIDAATAAAIPLAGLTAYQAIAERLALTAGERLLVAAGAGGVGSFAIQIARILGAEVVATGSAASAETISNLGAEPIDRTDALAGALGGRRIDKALDLVGPDWNREVRALLPDPSHLASVADPALRQAGGHYVFVRPDPLGLDTLAGWVREGRLRVPIAARFDLEHVRQAFELSMQGHARGKIVIDVAS